MTDVQKVLVREPVTVEVLVREPVTVEVDARVLPGPPGPPGPPGANGLGSISADPGNALTTGSDGGLHCPAPIVSTLHW